MIEDPSDSPLPSSRTTVRYFMSIRNTEYPKSVAPNDRIPLPKVPTELDSILYPTISIHHYLIRRILQNIDINDLFRIAK